MTSSTLSQSLCAFDPDLDQRPAIALALDVQHNDVEQPLHQHRKGQLIVALHGAVQCQVPGGLWMVPPQHGVWIPGGTLHSNRVTHNAQLCLLFVEPGTAALPDNCCTLSITPLVRELIRHLAHMGPHYAPGSATERVALVLIEQLADAQVEQLHLPISEHPKIRHIANALALDPSDRRTLGEWARALAMSERTLARLVQRETGLSFGRWRQQWHLVVALRQLASGAAVQQVAGDLGYDSVTAFITMFKKALGASPTQYFAALR